MQLTIKKVDLKQSSKGNPFAKLWDGGEINLFAWNKLYHTAKDLKPGDVVEAEWKDDGKYKTLTRLEPIFKGSVFNQSSSASGQSQNASTSMGSEQTAKELGVYSRYVLDAWLSGKYQHRAEALRDVFEIREMVGNEIHLMKKSSKNGESTNSEVMDTYIVSLLRKVKPDLPHDGKVWLGYIQAKVKYHNSESKARQDVVSELEDVLGGKSDLMVTPDGEVAVIPKEPSA